ncbi:hypothetical protein QJS04_geneDACA009744 [Acorus gramineus]|uniref:Uncharacterized protein n=1 Tax=Acorus gramineus TaxID=55184 RepID=A0AAV9BDN8_ACOGR|nr:hypothetical protein QJS04_geneDACA009744 [Acorus gramineus]
MVLMDSDDVRRFGVHARPMLPEQSFHPRKIYFLVDCNSRRAVSGLLNTTTAKETPPRIGIGIGPRKISLSRRRRSFRQKKQEKGPGVGSL